MYLYPENLKAQATLWLWTLRDVGVIGVSLVLSALALTQFGWFTPLVATSLYAFLAIRMENSSILDYLRAAVNYLFLRRQYFEWRMEL